MSGVGLRAVDRTGLSSRGTRRSLTRVVVWVVVVVVAVPLLWWSARLLASGWIPQGDDAIIAMRTHDVLTTHPPLLGMRSTSSLTSPGVYAHHPGPMEFYVLALPYLLTAYHPFGILLGCLATTLGLVGIALHSGYRAAGLRGLLVAAAVIVVLEHQFGAELVLPLNTWPPVIGLLAVQLLAWRLFLGQLSAMPWYAVCASFVAQAHIAFAPVVGLLTVALAVVGATRWRRRRSAYWPLAGFHRRPAMPRWRRRGWVTTVLVVLCWLPVLIDTVTVHPSNVAELLRIVTAPSTKHVGPLISLLYFLTLMAPHGAGMTIPQLAVGAVMLLVTLAAAAWLIRRRRTQGFDPHRPDSQLLVLYAVCALTCVPVVWMGSHVEGGLRLLYLNLLWAAPLLLVACTCWWVCLQIAAHCPDAIRERLRTLQRRVSLRRLMVPPIVIAALVTVSVAAHTGLYEDYFDYRGNVAQARSMVPSMVTALDQPGLRDRPVVIKWYGGLSWASIGPALEAALVAQGRDIYYDVVWPNPEYDQFRRIKNAPTGAVVAILRERSAPADTWSLKDPPAASRVLTFARTKGDGRGQVQLLIQRAPFSSSES